MSAARPKAWWRRWHVAWPLALVVAAAIAPWIAMRVQTHPKAVVLPPPGDRVTTAVAALRTDHLYVAPEMADRVPAQQRAQIIAALKSASAPAYLVYWNSRGDQGYWIEPDALDQIMAGVGVDGHYAIVNERQQVTARARGLTDPWVDVALVEQRPGPGLLAYAQAMAALPSEPESAGSHDYWGGPGGGIAAGFLMVGIGFPLVVGLVAMAGALFRKVTP